MPQSTFEKFLPASGILAGVLFVMYGYVQQIPEGNQGNALALLRAHQTENLISTIAGALFMVVMVFFATGIRQALRSGETGESTYSSAAFGGGILMAFSVGLTAMLTMAMMDAADNKDAVTSHVLGTLAGFNWLPWVAASAVLMLSTGLGGLKNAVLPKWLAIVTIILGVLCLLGPTGAAVWMVSPLWFIVVGVALVRRQAVATTAPSRPESVPV
jgi:hypothetical protein